MMAVRGRPRRVDILTPEGRKALWEAVSGLQGGYVISKADGSPIKTKSLEKALQRAIAKSGIDWKREMDFTPSGRPLRKRVMTL